MPNVNDIDRVIRLVDGDYKTSAPNEKKIIININNGEVLKSKPLAAGFRGIDLRYYVVSAQNNAECEGYVCKVRDIVTRHSINIQVDYDVSCPVGSEEKVASTLCRGDNPKIVLEECIEVYLKEFNRIKRNQDVNFIFSFYSLKEELRQFISNKVKTDTGLDFHPYISIEKEVEKLKTIPLSSDKFPIRVKDYDNDIPIEYKVGLEVVNDDKKVNAILKYNNISSLESILQNEINKVLSKECTLHELCFKFDTEVKPKLVDKINFILEPEGRQISYIKFDLILSDIIVPEAPTFKHTTECEIKDSAQYPIEVQNRVIMNLDDIGKLKRANIDSGKGGLEDWLKYTLDKIVQDVFFERTRIDLLYSLEEDKKAIKNRLEEETKKIGFSIRHLAFLPNLKELELLDGFKFDNSTSYKTKDTRIKIKLNTIINGKVHDFEDIEHYLGYNKFKEKLLNKAKDIIEQEIREKQPSEIFASAYEGENSIDKVLASKVKKSIEQEFKLTSDTKVSILFLETDLTKRMYALQSKFPEFKVKIKPHDSNKVIPYKVSYKIKGVHKDGFFTFQSNAFKPGQTDKEVKKINESIKHEIQKYLDPVPTQVSQYNNLKNLKSIEDRIIKPAIVSVSKNLFGLVIEDISIRRLSTIGEVTGRKTERKFIELSGETNSEVAQKDKQNLMAELDVLYERKKLFLQTGDKKQAKKISEQIEELTKSTSNYMDKSKELTKIDNEANEQFSFDNYDFLKLESPDKEDDINTEED